MALNPFEKAPRMTLLLILLIIAAGVRALFLLPRIEDPELAPRVAHITTQWPGVAADKIELQVTKPLEDYIAEVSDIKAIVSFSAPGQSQITVELEDSVSETLEYWVKIRGKLDEAKALLPQGVGEPVFINLEPKAYGSLIAIEDLKGDQALLLEQLSEDLKVYCQQIPGTEKVDIFGEPEIQVQVQLQADKLQQYGVTPLEVAGILKQDDNNQAAGLLTKDRSNKLVQLPEMKHYKELAQSKLFSRNHQDIHLYDLAKVEKSESSPPFTKNYLDGNRVVVLGLYSDSSQRIDLWTDRVKETLSQWEKSLPPNFEAKIIFEQNIYTEQRLNGLVLNLAQAAVLVIGVVFLLMGWRASLLVVSSLPLTMMIVFAYFESIDVQIHQMSIMGLIIALGLLIDNSIITTEESRKMFLKKTELSSIPQRILEHLGMPLASSTLTTILAFMPLYLMPGPAGEFVGSVALAVIIALLGSLFLSLFLLPVFFTWFEKYFPTAQEEESHWYTHGLNLPSFVEDLWAKFITKTLRWPKLMLLAFFCLAFSGFFGVTTLKEQFFPASDRNQLLLTVQLQSGSSIHEAEAISHEIEKLLKENPYTVQSAWFLGQNAPPFFYNLMVRREGIPHFSQAMITLDSHHHTDKYIDELQDKLDRQFPQARCILKKLEQGPPFLAPIELRIYGPDPDIIGALGEELRALMLTIPEVLHTDSQYGSLQQQWELKLDETKAKELGLSKTKINQELAARLNGIQIGNFLDTHRSFPILVHMQPEDRDGLEDLLKLPIARDPQTQRPILLEELGHFELSSERSFISRRNQRRYDNIQGYVRNGVLPSQALKKIQAKIDAGEFVLPQGYDLEIGGESAERDKAVGNLLSSVGILLLLMISVLVLSFHSFRLAALIGVIGFLSAGYGLLALSISRLDFSFMAIIGTMGLIGVAINDSIVVLANLEEARRHNDAPLNDEQACEVVVESTRHVITTSLTTSLGFIPLLLSGSKLWPPLAICIGGGVLGATAAAVLLIPPLHHWISHLSPLKNRPIE